MIALNVGSGQRRFESIPGVIEWKNLDCVSRPGQVPDIVCDVLKEPLPFEDGSVDLVMLYHFFEHLPLMGADGVVAECYRVLRVGGSLIIVVPDLRALAQRWLTHQISDWIYVINLMGADQGEPGDIHRWHYTPESLAEKLMQCKWSRMGRFDWRAIPGTDIMKDFWYYGMEATK